MDFKSLEEAEKRAIFRTLWEMARVDRRVGESERLRLETLHEALFAAPMPKTAFPYPDEASLAERMARPQARSALFTAVFSLLRADERTTPGERKLFAELCDQLGIEADEQHQIWARCAREYFVTRSRTIIDERLDGLADELVALGEDLELSEADDGAIEAELQAAAAAFRLAPARRRRLLEP